MIGARTIFVGLLLLSAPATRAQIGAQDGPISENPNAPWVKLRDPGAPRESLFGSEMAVIGDLLLVGNRGYNRYQGSVDVYRVRPEGARFHQRLTIPGSQQMGYGVSAEDGHVLVSSQANVAYHFVLEGGSFRTAAPIEPPVGYDPAEFARWSVSMSGGWAAVRGKSGRFLYRRVGDRFEFDRYVETGFHACLVGSLFAFQSAGPSVTIWRRSGDSWSEEAVVPLERDPYRMSCLENEIALIAPDVRGEYHAWTVRRGSGAWDQKEPISFDDPEAFPSDLTLTSDFLFVSFCLPDSRPSYHGRLLIHARDRERKGWTVFGEFHAPIPSESDSFGDRVILFGDYVAVSGLYEDQLVPDYRDEMGAVYVTEFAWLMPRRNPVPPENEPVPPWNGVGRPYPNPAGSEFVLPLQTTAAGTARVSLFDSAGSRVFERDFAIPYPGLMDLRIDVSRLPTGLYTHRTVFRGAVARGSILVMR